MLSKVTSLEASCQIEYKIHRRLTLLGSYYIISSIGWTKIQWLGNRNDHVLTLEKDWQGWAVACSALSPFSMSNTVYDRMTDDSHDRCSTMFFSDHRRALKIDHILILDHGPLETTPRDIGYRWAPMSSQLHSILLFLRVSNKILVS